MELEAFEKYVEAALKDIPQKFRDLMKNITIEVEPEQLKTLFGSYGSLGARGPETRPPAARHGKAGVLSLVINFPLTLINTFSIIFPVS